MEAENQLRYQVAFNHVRGIGAIRTARLLEYFGSLEAAWQASPTALRLHGLPEKIVQSLLSFRDRTDPSELLAAIQKRGIRILSRDDPYYPPLLKMIEAPPPVLYVRGEMPDASAQYVAIVGTRRMTGYGKNVAEELSAYLAGHGVVVVSGLARGVDGTAHQAALDHKGRTVAVLGCGVDVIYPPEHRSLAEAVVRNGALISDYPPGTQPDRVNFPPRNRIISGMACACIVIEAGEKSGSLITARFAAEQGREVFVLPGNFNAPQSQGANRLIRDGARPLCAKEELLEYIRSDQAILPHQLPKPIQMSFESPQEQAMMALIEAEALHIDEITRLSGLPAGKVASMLTLLVLKGFVVEVAPQQFQKNNALY